MGGERRRRCWRSLDATRAPERAMEAADRRVSQIGKSLGGRPDGLEAGLYLCSLDVFDELVALASARSYFTLAQAMASLAAEGRLGALPTYGRPWFAIETTEQLESTAREISDGAAASGEVRVGARFPWQVRLTRADSFSTLMRPPSSLSDRRLVLAISAASTALRVLPGVEAASPVHRGLSGAEGSEPSADWSLSAAETGPAMATGGGVAHEAVTGTAPSSASGAAFATAPSAATHGDAPAAATPSDESEFDIVPVQLGSRPSPHAAAHRPGAIGISDSTSLSSASASGDASSLRSRCCLVRAARAERNCTRRPAFGPPQPRKTRRRRKVRWKALWQRVWPPR